MEFPITDQLDEEECETWIMAHFHPEGLKCPTCGASVAEASPFRRTEKSQLTVYRCRRCRHVYNLYSGTLFQQRHLRPAQVVLLMRGVLKGEASNVLAAELGLHYLTVLQLRRAIQERAQQMQPTTPLDDLEVESDELFQNAGEKRGGTLRPI
jgi:transposase-like protein